MPANDIRPRKLVLELLHPALHRASMAPDDVDDSLNVIDSGLFDSIGFLDFVARIEDRAGAELELFDADPDVLTTVGGLIDLVAEATGPLVSPRRILHD